jgi:hypothetical protein
MPASLSQPVQNGDLQGLIGPSMQTIPALEAGDSDAEDIG